METILITIHYILCFFLIMIILLQAGKGADIGAVFGGASQTVFGSRGPATFLNKATAIVAVCFIVTSVWLAHIAKTRTSETVLDSATTEQQGIIPDADKPLMDIKKELDQKAAGKAEEKKPAEEKKK